MKKFCISFLVVLIIIISLMSVVGSFSGKAHNEYLRIHIRANSNSESDQAVKYSIKEAVVEYLTPFLAGCDSKEKAERTIKESLKNLEAIADNVLKEKGYSYTSSAKVNNEEFPTRIYDGLTLESGYYDALIIKLGEGTGDNWWCVVYPPLCFTGRGEYIYRSKIKEIIDGFLHKEN